jgi:hypothetical protein
MESILSTAIGAFVKSLVELGAKQLPEFFKKKDRTLGRSQERSELLYDLYNQLKDLESDIDLLIGIFDSLAEHSDFDYQEMNARVEHAVFRVRKTLAAIDLDLKSMQPQFEIHAVGAAPLIDTLARHESLLIDRIGLAPAWGRKSDAKKYEADLRTLKKLALQAKKTLAAFIRDFYSFV